MSKEITFYSIGRGSLNINGKFYYGLDYLITDFMMSLEKENQQLKEKSEKQQFAIVENCDLRLEIEQLKQIEKEHQKINGELREEMKELRSWLEEEKDRLARECSQIYEDSLGKTRLVNEDIFNEVNRIISKLNELEGKDEKNINE